MELGRKWKGNMKGNTNEIERKYQASTKEIQRECSVDPELHIKGIQKQYTMEMKYKGNVKGM